MQHTSFATQIIASIDHNLIGDDTLTVITPEPCQVLGFTIGTAFVVLPLIITITSADGLTVYYNYLLSAVDPTSIVEFTPFTADKGLAWKSTGAGSFSILVYSTFFLSQRGS
jgi:hypothetical protein